jgi:hypothetical protein
MRRDFVFDDVGARHNACQAAPASGSAYTGHRRLAYLIAELPEPALNRLDGPSLRTEISVKKNSLVYVDEHDFGRDTADVDSQEVGNIFRPP